MSGIPPSQYSVDSLFTLSERIYKAEQPEALVDVLHDVPQMENAFSLTLLYVDNDAAGNPLTLTLVSSSNRAQSQSGVTVSVGTRFSFAEYPFSKLWFGSPNNITVIPDLEASVTVDENSKRLLSRSGTKALVLLPLLEDGLWVGLMIITWHQTHTFTAQAERFYEAVAHLLSGRVATLRAQDKLRTQITENELIATIIAALSRATDEAAILQALTPFAQRYHADRMSLSYFYMDAPGQPDEFEVVASKNLSSAEGMVSVDGLQGLRFKTELFGMLKPMMANSDMPHIIEDVAADTDLDESARQIAIQQGVKAAVTIALKIADRWLGVITLQWAAPAHFDESLKGIIAVLRPSVEAAVLARRNLLEANARREQAEAQAHISESRLQQFVSDAAVIIFGIGKDGKFTLSEGAGLKALGLTPGQAVGGDAFEMYSAFPNVLEALKRALNGEEMQVELQLGEELVFQSVFSPSYDASGTFLGVTGVSMNISDRRKAERERDQFIANLLEESKRREQAEAQARISQTRLQQIVANAPFAIYSTDKAGVLNFFDGAGLKPLGLKPGQLVGVNVMELYPNEPRVRAGVQRALNGEEVREALDLDGVIYENIYTPIFDDNGQPNGLIGLGIDVTERDKLINELRESGQRLDIALEGAKLGVWDQNLITNEIGYSDQWARLLGYQPEELLAFSKAGELLVHPDDLQRITENLVAYLSGHIPEYVNEVRIKAKSGEYRWVLSSGRIVERLPDGQPARIVGVQFDINDRKLAEQDRERLIRELRETARFKDEFLATMSHELRTPLNAMIGLLGIVLMGNRVSDMDKNMIVRARANSERLLSLINNILDISRMEAGRLEIVPSDVDMRGMLAKVERDLSVLAEQKKLDLRVEIDPEMPATLRVDEDAVNKILINLVGNAVKFTEKGHVIVRLAQRADALRIEVQDSGIGIPVHQREIIFDSFRQADGSTTRQYGGSGLGLSIVRNLCRAMDGSIRVESEVGIGSTFLVSLPLEKHAAPELAVAV